jgi:hypothetical protein
MPTDSQHVIPISLTTFARNYLLTQVGNSKIAATCHEQSVLVFLEQYSTIIVGKSVTIINLIVR